jgi:pSer/pThr/pTyr-binding forkhead associated (FHA) protein
MGTVTIQIIEGLERGRVFEDLTTPVSIGREDDNTVRLNDERVSRFHAKIQEDGDRLILTDLDSTNGTRVNGHPVQMRVLRVGDQLSIGRCLLVVGSAEQVAHRQQQLRRGGSPALRAGEMTVPADHGLSASSFGDGREMLADLFPDGPPEPPTALQPLQRATLSDFIAYTHEQIQHVLHAGREEPTPGDTSAAGGMRVDWSAWQRLLQLEMDLAVYLRRIAEPGEAE